MKWTTERKTNTLSGIFVGCLIGANLIGLKIGNFGLFEASVGILLFPILFLVTDIIAEVHGKKKAQEIVITGFIALLIVLLATIIAVYIIPFADRSWVTDEYTKIFGTTIRIFIASIIAFLISQLHDVWAFHFWKQKTKGKHLWLRNNLSTSVSQFLDTTIFMFIAFYNISPKFNIEFIFSLIIPYWIIKVLFALFDTPFCYLGVKWLKSND